MINSILLLAAGIISLLVSTEIFIRLSTKISNSLKISPLIIGTTIVAFGTSLPELVVSLTATARFDTGLAFGNIIGSNIINILMVFGVGILFGGVRIGTQKTQKNAIILLVATLLFVVLQFAPISQMASGILFFVSVMAVTFGEYHLAIIGRANEDKRSFNKSSGFSKKDFILLLLTFGGIILGGILTVTSVEEISVATGYSTSILGLSLTAVATSLPELLATIFSEKERQGKLAVGNILGSNIYNLLLIGGVIMLFSNAKGVAFIDWVWLFVTTLLFIVILKTYKGKFVPKIIGLILLLICIIYFVSLASNNGIPVDPRYNLTDFA